MCWLEWRAVVVVILTAATRAAGECGKPPYLENGSPRDEFLNQVIFPVGTKVTYRCIPGFTLKQGISPTITCEANSSWSRLEAICERKSCGSPGEILNGRYNATGNKFGDKATFSCDTGYNLVGRDTRVCEDSGWSGQVPTCEAGSSLRTTRHTTRVPNSSSTVTPKSDAESSGSTVTPKSDKGGSAGTSVGLQHILSLLLTATLIFCLQL